MGEDQMPGTGEKISQLKDIGFTWTCEWEYPFPSQAFKKKKVNETWGRG